MKATKIISIIGGIIYLVYWIFILLTSFKLGGVYSDLDIGYNPLVSVVLVNVLGLGLVVANFGYFYYLVSKEKKGELVKNAVLVSILIAGVPLFLFPAISVIFLILPIYSITSAF